MCMPDNLRLDMAIKYSSETYIDNLEEVRICCYFTIPKLSFHLVVNVVKRSKVTAVIQYVHRFTRIQRTKALENGFAKTFTTNEKLDLTLTLT